MAERETTKREEGDESADERRSRQSEREVTEWETAFAAAKAQGSPTGADRANAGAIVSRAHRAEQTSGRSPSAARPEHTPIPEET